MTMIWGWGSKLDITLISLEFPLNRHIVYDNTYMEKLKKLAPIVGLTLWEKVFPT